MNRPHWGRILAFGALAGVVWTLLSALVLAVVGQEVLATLPERSGRVQGLLLAANVAAGIWAIWLYSCVRAQYGPGLRAAVIATVGWWTIQTLQSSKWAILEAVPLRVAWGPALGTLPAMFLATAFGAWCYENYRRTSTTSI